MAAGNVGAFSNNLVHEGNEAMLYRWKVRLLRTERGMLAWRRWRLWRGSNIGNYDRLPEYIRQYAPEKSFADIGCMWGVNGAYSFLAEEAGATTVKAVDVFGPTPEFDAEKQKRASAVEFILGDATDPIVIQRVGSVDTVLCAGVLYHHPSPFDLLVALRAMCRRILILRSATIPEIKGLPNAAVFYPQLTPAARELWSLSSLGIACQFGIQTEFRPEEGYGNWFWGLTPTCLRSLVATAGFKVVRRFPEPFAQTLICQTVDVAFRHHLPDRERAREMGREISRSGKARPA
jgi:2-polyprenyl-3-methyl-5-hydroxy-6-metoxy-1,4-benzoquinol methylase